MRTYERFRSRLTRCQLKGHQSFRTGNPVLKKRQVKSAPSLRKGKKRSRIVYSFLGSLLILLSPSFSHRCLSFVFSLCFGAVVSYKFLLSCGSFQFRLKDWKKTEQKKWNSTTVKVEKSCRSLPSPQAVPGDRRHDLQVASVSKENSKKSASKMICYHMKLNTHAKLCFCRHVVWMSNQKELRLATRVYQNRCDSALSQAQRRANNQ